MNSPAELCRHLQAREERSSRVGRCGKLGLPSSNRVGRIDLAGHAAALERRRSARSTIPLRPTPELVREAEQEAAEAQHALAMADPSCPAEQRDRLSRSAEQARIRAHHMRQALNDGQ